MITAGVVYARMKGVSAGIAVPIIAAFLLELPLYLAPLFAGARAAAARLPRAGFAALLAFSSLLPYLAYSLPTHTLNSFDLFRLGGLAISLSFWYVILPRAPWSDFLFLIGPVGIMVSKVLRQIYDSPLSTIRLDILGHLMLIHVAALSVLVIRGLQGVKPGLLPTRREAWIGARNFLLFIPIGFALAWILHLRLRPVPLPIWYAIPLFLGIYLVTAFSEEFAFRGVIQQHLTRGLGPWPALVATSLLFGLSHVNFGVFPNWPMVGLAGVAGLFYGEAYQEAGSIRASMLTHSLTVVVWTLWLR
jgi:membrane protease YdiL (CAAX protease family)